MLNLLSNVETSLYEIQMLNYQYENIQLRNFPFGGDIIFVRIIRDNDSIVPHGDTQLRYKDRLIVTGTKEYVDELKQELNFIIKHGIVYILSGFRLCTLLLVFI